MMEGDEEEYAIEGPPRKHLVDTPEGMQRRRVRFYHDRTDFRGKCVGVTCCLWTWLFSMEDFLRAAVIVGSGVVGEYSALKRGETFEQAVGEGWGIGIICYLILSILREQGYRCSDEKTTRRGVRDETSICSVFSYCITVVLLIVVLGIFGTVHEYCVEGVSCKLPTDWILSRVTRGGGDGEGAD